MGIPCVIKPSGGLPVVVSAYGAPMTEATNGYGIAVTQALNGIGLGVSGITFGPDVTAPIINSVNTVSNVENTPLAHILTANETVTWAKTGGADTARFEISGSTLRWLGNGTKDFEAPNDADTNNTYVVQVTATDLASNASTPQTITVTVTNADEVAPTITTAATANVAENAVLAIALTANETVTWSLSGGADVARFEISGTTLRWLSDGTKNYEAPDDADTNNTYVVQVRATDTASNITDKTITVTVTDVVDTDTTAPVITTSSTATVAENVTLSIALTADEAVTWSLFGGADISRFEISGATLRWLGNGTKDFETPNDANTDNAYIVIVRATDTASNTTDKTITVTVTNVAEGLLDGLAAPVLTWVTGATDNTPQISLVHSDLQVSDTVDFELDTVNTFNSGNLVQVSNTVDAGEDAAEAMAFDIPSPLANGTWYARAQVNRSGHEDGDWSNIVNQTIAVDTTAPTITTSATASVAENATLSVALTADEAVTWSISGGADIARFEISGTTLRWLSNGTKDFEAPDDANTDNAYIVTVRATDTASNTTDKTITVTVTDVGDTDVTAPTISSLSPADGATGVAIGANFVITFSETVVAGTTASFRLYKTTGDVLVETFTQANFGGAVVISGATVTINWAADLLNSTDYYVRVDAGSVKDAAGNSFAGILNNTTWNITSVAGASNSVTLDQLATQIVAETNVGGISEYLTITAGLTNPALIVVVTIGNAVSATSPVVAWDSNAQGGAAQPMTLLINQDAGGGKQVMIWGLRNPRAGNWRIGMSWTGSAQYTVTAMSLYHVNQASDAAAFPSAVGTSAGGTPNSITVTTGANNFAVAAFSGEPGNVSGTSHTEWFRNNTTSTWSNAACYGASSGASMTMTQSPGHAAAVAAAVCIAHD